MKDDTVIYPDGTILEVEHETRSATKNPNGEWTVRGTLKVNVTGMTRADVIALAMPTVKIARQRCRATMSRDEAVKYLNEPFLWSEAGRMAKVVDVEAGFKAKFASLTDEQKAEKIKELEALMKAGFGK